MSAPLLGSGEERSGEELGGGLGAAGAHVLVLLVLHLIKDGMAEANHGQEDAKGDGEESSGFEEYSNPSVDEDYQVDDSIQIQLMANAYHQAVLHQQ